jgi:hypothetical protein
MRAIVVSSRGIRAHANVCSLCVCCCCCRRDVRACRDGTGDATRANAAAAAGSTQPDPCLLKTLYTKQTPVFGMRFTRRNLLLVAGGFVPRKAGIQQ